MKQTTTTIHKLENNLGDIGIYVEVIDGKVGAVKIRKDLNYGEQTTYGSPRDPGWDTMLPVYSGIEFLRTLHHLTGEMLAKIEEIHAETRR